VLAWGDGQDVGAWDRGSVLFLDHPVEPTLGGTAATAYLLGRLGIQNAPAPRLDLLQRDVSDLECAGTILQSQLEDDGRGSVLRDGDLDVHRIPVLTVLHPEVVDNHGHRGYAEDSDAITDASRIS